MKAPVDKASTARVLADIADAVRPVERARTAAAVERVIHVTAPSVTTCVSSCPCWVEETRADWIHRDDATPGMDTGCDPECPCMADERRRYAPEVVSPHLFGGAS